MKDFERIAIITQIPEYTIVLLLVCFELKKIALNIANIFRVRSIRTADSKELKTEAGK